MSTRIRIEKTLEALDAVTKHLANVRTVAAWPGTSSLDQLAAEVRDALGAVDDELRKLLDAFVQPILGELPEEIRELCYLALTPELF